MGGLMSKVIDSVCGRSVAESRALILAYEEFAKTKPQVEIPVTHYIHGGMYARQITIPKDTFITGQLYKFDHFDVMISGDVTISTDDGVRKRITGYNVFEGLSGKKRAGYAHEDTTWITFHTAEGVDGEEIQSGLTVGSFEELEQFYLSLDQISYREALVELGYTEVQVQSQVQNTTDMIDMPGICDYVYTAHSNIHGLGLYSVLGHQADTVVCPARIDGKRTIAGRYANHSHTPNCHMHLASDGNMLLVAKRKLEPREELTVDYFEVISKRQDQGDLCPE